MRHYTEGGRSGVASGGAEGGGSTRSAARRDAAAEARSIVETAVANVLGASVAPDEPLVDAGLDSLGRGNRVTLSLELNSAPTAAQ